jgi:exodeoxyribonuclease V gamma subunit
LRPFHKGTTAAVPPSVLISELLDYLEENFTLADGRAVSSQVITVHRLQAFSAGLLW